MFMAVLVSYGCCNTLSQCRVLEKPKCIILHFWMSQSRHEPYRLKSRLRGILCSSVVPGGEFISMRFLASKSSLHSLVRGPFLYLQSRQVSIFSFLSDCPCISTLPALLQEPLWLYWSHQDNPRKSPHVKILHPSAKSLSLRKKNTFTGLGD